MFMNETFAQVAINTTGAAANSVSILDISSSTNNKGVIFPRVTTAQMNAMTGTAAQGLLIFNSTENMFYFNNSSTTTANWIPIISSTAGSSTGIGGWSLTGNTGITAGTNYLGTGDAIDLVVKTNGTQRMRILSTGNVGIGTLTSPGYKLTLDGTGNMFGIENTASLAAKNSGGAYETFMWPRWSDNIMYNNYGTGGFYIRNNSSSIAMFMDNSNNIGINNNSPAQKVDVGGNIVASYTGSVYPIVYWGSSGSRTETRTNAGLQGNAGALSGFYESSTASSANNYPYAAASTWWHMIDCRHSNTGNNYAMQISGSFFDQDLYYRKTNGSANTAWTKVLNWKRQQTIAIGSTTEIFNDDILKLRWNGSSNRVEISTNAAVYNGSWATYKESEEHTFNGAQDPHSEATTYAATYGSWTTILNATVAPSASGAGQTFYLSRVDSNAYPCYYGEVLVHGTYVTIILQRIKP